MKHFALILSIFSLLTVACTDKKSTEEPVAKVIDTIPMLVTQVQQCSRLYTTEYRIHKIITHDDKMKLSGSFMKQDFSVTLPLGDRRIAINILPRLSNDLLNFYVYDIENIFILITMKMLIAI